MRTMLSILLLLVLTACSSSQITQSWKSEYPSRFYNKILVLAISVETEVSTQQKMEEYLVNDLQAHGYNAVSSFKEFGPKVYRQMKEEAVVNKLRNSGFDAVITIVLLNKERERYYIPGHPYYSPYAGYYRQFWGYYTTIYDRIYTPGYYVIDTNYFWESNLFDIHSKELIYSVQTESFDPTSSETLAHKYGKLIVQDMMKNHVLVNKEVVTKNKH